MTDLLVLAAYCEIGGAVLSLFTSVFFLWLYLFSDPMKAVVDSARYNTWLRLGRLGLVRLPAANVPDAKTVEDPTVSLLE